jgi:hypothetical protein
MPFMDNCAILATYDVGDNSVNKEDLLDVITNISPDKTPLFSSLRKTVANATLHQWLIDNLTAPGDPEDPETGQEADVHCTPEASDADFEDLEVPCRVNNLTHIFRETYDVSDTQRAVATAGMSDMLAYQIRKKSKELALKIEYALIWSRRATQTADQHPGDCESGSGCRKMDGLRVIAGWDEEDFDCLSPDMQGTVYDPSGSPYTELTPAELDNLNQLMWEKGADPKNIWVGAYQKRKISSFCLDCETRTIGASEKKLVNSIDVYESDFGLRRINLHRYMYSRELLMTDEEYLAIAVLRAIKAELLARVGNHVAGMIEGELTLEVLAPAAIGLIVNLTNDATEE